MRRVITVLGVISIFLMLSMGAGAQLSSFDPPPWVDELPDMEPMDWADGQYATYHMSIAAEDEEIGCDMRVAIVGSEVVDGEDYYWFEVDVYNVTGIPDDIGMEEGDFESFYLQLLMAEYDFTAAEEDPEQFMQDLISMNFIKRVIFQINDEDPMELDLSFLMMMAPMLEMSLEEGMTEFESEFGDEAEDIWEDIDWGIGEETISTPAGTFNDAINFWMSFEKDGSMGEFDVFLHQDVPLSTLVKVDGKVSDSGEDVDVECSVIEIGDDAESWITGEPILFNPMEDMMGAMEMS